MQRVSFTAAMFSVSQAVTYAVYGTRSTVVDFQGSSVADAISLRRYKTHSAVNIAGPLLRYCAPSLPQYELESQQELSGTSFQHRVSIGLILSATIDSEFLS